MRLSQIRAELLQQHADLRALIGEALVVAEDWRGGAAGREDLLVVLGELSHSVTQHNAREEELLRGTIAGIDAWGPVREGLMVEAHIREHEELLRALSNAGTELEADAAVPGLNALAIRMLLHMSHEEETFLGEELLRDEAGPPTDYFGG